MGGSSDIAEREQKESSALWSVNERVLRTESASKDRTQMLRRVSKKGVLATESVSKVRAQMLESESRVRGDTVEREQKRAQTQKCTQTLKRASKVGAQDTVEREQKESASRVSSEASKVRAQKL